MTFLKPQTSATNKLNIGNASDVTTDVQDINTLLLNFLKELIPVYATSPGHSPDLVEKGKAVIAKAAMAETMLADFFYNDEDMGAFIGAYAIGHAPVGAVITANGDLVIANGDRDAFYTLREEAGKVRVFCDNDAINLVDPEATSNDLGLYSSPTEALRAVCTDQGLQWPGNDGPKP